MAEPQLLCQLNDQVIKRKWWKLHGNISRNGHGKAIIGRYGGCFEEDIIRLCVIEHIISQGLDAPAKFAPRLDVRNGNARYRRGYQIAER
mgnify:CR=1 FL=1